MRRPPLSKELTDAICNLTEEGNAPSTAAVACGLPRSTFHVWMQKGREAKEGDEELAPYLEFFDRVEQSRAKAETVVVQQLKTAIPAEGRLTVEWLKRRNNAEWSDRQQIELSGKDGGPIQTQELEKMSDEELSQKTIDEVASLADTDACFRASLLRKLRIT